MQLLEQPDMRHALISLTQRLSRQNNSRLLLNRRNIHNSFRLSQLNKPQSRPSVLELEGIASPFYEGHPDYRCLLQRLQKYNLSLQQSNDNEQVALFKSRYYQSLQHMLKTVSLYEEPKDMAAQLANIRKWSDQKEVEIKLALSDRPYQPYKNYMLLKDNESTCLEDSHLQQPFSQYNEEQLPSTRREETLRDFRERRRSLNEYSFTPQERLKEYKRKVFNIVQDIIPAEPESEVVKIVDSDFSMPPPPPKEEEPPEQDPNNNPDQNPAEVPEEAGAAADQEQEKQEQAPAVALDRLAPSVKPYLARFKERQVRRKQQLECQSTFQMHLASKEVGLRATQQIHRRNFRQEIKEKNENEQQLRIKFNWARRRARAQHDLARKMELRLLDPTFQIIPQPPVPPQSFSEQDYAKYFPQRKQQRVRREAKSVDCRVQLPRLNEKEESVFGLQKAAARIRIKNLKKECGSLLGLNENQHHDQQEQGVQKKVHRSLCQHSTRHKAFSQILMDNSMDNERELQMQEIKDIKEKLAKKKVFLNGRVLANGILGPEGIEEDRGVPSVELYSNPFDVPAKKKKK